MSPPDYRPRGTAPGGAVRDGGHGGPARDDSHGPAGGPARDDSYGPAGGPARDDSYGPAGGPARDDGHGPADGPARDDGRARGDGRLPGAAAPRPMRADARRNYQALLAAASAVFIEHGADDASLEEIARRAGVGIGTLYRHFPTRQDLLEAVYRDQVELLRARAQELLTAAPPGEALVTWLRALIEFSSTKRNLTSAMLANSGPNPDLKSATSEMMRESASALLARAQRAGEVRPDAQPYDLLRLVHAVAMAAQRGGADAGQADRMLGLIMDGLHYQPAG